MKLPRFLSPFRTPENPTVGSNITRPSSNAAYSNATYNNASAIAATVNTEVETPTAITFPEYDDTADIEMQKKVGISDARSRPENAIFESPSAKPEYSNTTATAIAVTTPETDESPTPETEAENEEELKKQRIKKVVCLIASAIAFLTIFVGRTEDF